MVRKNARAHTLDPARGGGVRVIDGVARQLRDPRTGQQPGGRARVSFSKGGAGALPRPDRQGPRGVNPKTESATPTAGSIAHAFVADNPCYALTGEDGGFRITDMPAGDYALVATQSGMGDTETPVTLKGGRCRNLWVLPTTQYHRHRLRRRGRALQVCMDLRFVLPAVGAPFPTPRGPRRPLRSRRCAHAGSTCCS